MLEPAAHALRRIVALMARMLFLAAGLVTLAHRGDAAPPLPRAPSPVHTPLVATPHPGDPPGYRDDVAAAADQYARSYYSADYGAALAEARRGQALALQVRNQADEAQFLKALGYVSWVVGDTAAALDYEQRLLSLADQLDHDGLRANAHRTLGAVYRQIGDREAGLRHTQLALSLAERAGDQPLRYGTLNNLAIFALDAGDTATARRLLEEVLAFRESQGERWDIAGCLGNLGDVALAEQKPIEALALHERALALRREIADERGIVRSLRQVAGSLRRLGRTDEALAQLDDALERARAITGHELLRDTWQEISLVREARGEFAEALAAEREAGKARESLAGERARTRMAELQARFDDAQKRATIQRLEREQRLQEAEIRAQQAVLGRVRFRNILLATGLISGVLGLGSIIWAQRARLTAEHRARESAEQANALKTRLLRMVSHDIRAPVGTVLTQAEEWSAEQTPGSGDERLAIIRHESRHVLDLASNLLDAAALEAGAMRLNLAPVSLTQLVAATVARMKPTAGKKEQQIRLSIPAEDPCLVPGDADRLEQILRNLISNALKYGPRRSDVEVRLERLSSRVVLSVRDHGPGIAADAIPRLFLPFSRLATPPTGGESSHGLGLSIAHDLTRLHGGRLSVESSPGQGAVFTVELPVTPNP